jgi:anti-sigma B factor antagonist
MQISVEQPRKRTRLVRLRGRFDASGIDRVKQVWLQDEQGVYFIVDMSETTFMDSLALAALVSGLKTARQRGGDLVIAHPSQAVQVIFELTRMDAAFRIVEDVREVIALDVSREPVVVPLPVRFDANGIAGLDAQIAEHLAEGNVVIVLDGTATQLIDSRGLTAMQTLKAQVETARGVLVMAGLHGPARSVIEITRLDQALRMYDSVTEAVQALRAQTTPQP